MSGVGNSPWRHGRPNGNSSGNRCIGRHFSHGSRRLNGANNDARRGNWNGPNSRQDFNHAAANNNNLHHGRGGHHPRPPGFHGNGPPDWPGQQRFQNPANASSVFGHIFPGLSAHLFSQAFPTSFPNGGNQPTLPGAPAIHNVSNNPPMQVSSWCGFPNTVPPHNQLPFTCPPFNLPPCNLPPFGSPPYNTPPFSPPPSSPPPFIPPPFIPHPLIPPPFHPPPNSQQPCTQEGCTLPICNLPGCSQQPFNIVPCNQPPADQPPTDQQFCILPAHAVSQDTTYYSLPEQQQRLQVVYSDDTHVTLQSATEMIHFTRAEIMRALLHGICRCQCGILNQDLLDRMINMEAELSGFPQHNGTLMAINASLWSDNMLLRGELQRVRASIEGHGPSVAGQECIGDIRAVIEGIGAIELEGNAAAAIELEGNTAAIQPEGNGAANQPNGNPAANEGNGAAMGPEGNAAVIVENAAGDVNESAIKVQEDLVANHSALSSSEEHTLGNSAPYYNLQYVFPYPPPPIPGGYQQYFAVTGYPDTPVHDCGPEHSRMANEGKDGGQSSGGAGGGAWRSQPSGFRSQQQQPGHLHESYVPQGQQGWQTAEGQRNRGRQGGSNNNNNSSNNRQPNSNAIHQARAPRFEPRSNNASAPRTYGQPRGNSKMPQPIRVMRRGSAEATGTPAEATGTPAEATGTPAEATGTPAEATGTPAEATGTPGEATGTPAEATGTPAEATGTFAEATGTPAEATGTPAEATGTPAEEAPRTLEKAPGALSEATGAIPKARVEPEGERNAVKGYKGGDHRREGDRQPHLAEITEVDGDLFQAPEDHSLAHCVAADFRMGSGIAVKFSSKFQKVDELLNQRKTVGEVAVLAMKQRYVYYLVTKQLSNGKPYFEDLRRSVAEMRRHCVECSVTRLALPRIGCGLDRLSWSQVKRMLGEEFAGTGVAITVYNFPQAEDQAQSDLDLGKRKSLLWISHHKMSLVDIEPKTGLLFLCCEDALAVTPAMASLDSKHRFLHELRTERKPCGDVKRIARGDEVLYGLVVRKTKDDPVSYVHLMACLRRLRKFNEKDYFMYFGIEACRDGEDALTMEKVMTVFKVALGSISYRLDVWVCWPKEVEADHVWEEPREVRHTGW